MSFKKVQSPAVTLYTGLSASGTSMIVSPYPRDLDGNKLTMAALGSTPQMTVDPKVSSYEEIIGFTGITDNGDDTATITGLSRDLASSSLATPGTGKQHGAGAVVLFSWNPQDVARLGALENDQTWTGLNAFSQLPTSTGGNATDPTQLITYAQALALATGTANVNRLVVAGKAGETVSAGQILYLKAADNRWYKASSAASSTSENLILGIAQGAGTAGNTITSGVLIRGVDSNQTGLSADTLYYLSTGGAMATSAGTKSVALGFALTTTTFLFNANYNLQLTQDQQNALAGDDSSIAVGSGNKVVTQTGLQIGAESHAVTTGAANTYEVALTPVPTALVEGMTLRLKTNFGNTGAALLAITGVNGATLGTATITIATPAVITLNSHGLVAGDIVKFTTTGALPTGIVAGTKYYVISSGLTSNTFQISATLGGSAINTTGSQSGTHTLIRQTANITKLGTTALVSGDIASGQEITLTWDNTQWQLQNPVVNQTLFANGVTTYDVSTASGTQTIAHGLGRTPKLVRITALLVNPTNTTSPIFSRSFGVYNGTTNSCVYEILIASGGSFASNNQIAFNSSVNGIRLTQSFNDSTTVASAIITVDGTNITLTWTKAGSPAGTANLMWEVIG